MKIKIIILGLVVTCFIFFLSCNNELDQTDPNVVSENEFWEDEDDFLQALAGTYRQLKDRDGGFFDMRGTEMSNGRGDDFFIRNDVKDLYEFSTFSNTPTNGVLATIYEGGFSGIFRANQIIQKAPNSDMPSATKSEIIAEAKFLRAMEYFYLIINFGSIPVITTVPEGRDDYFHERATIDEAWDQVTADLKVARDSLPITYPDKWVGRATGGAAIGYLGKAYVYQEKWEEAIEEFEMLVNPDGTSRAPYDYDLLENYEDNFMAAHDNNRESLFEIQNQDVAGSGAEGDNADESGGVTTPQEFAPAEVQGWFEAFPTNKIFDEFQKEKTTKGDFDPRMYASLIWDYPNAEFYNRPFSDFDLQFGFKSMIRKYQNWDQNDEGQHISEINEKTLRYSDILLLYAEALVKVGRDEETYSLINKVRHRAELSDLSSGLEKAEIMAEIRHQRMLEFFREGQRFYDLRRWGLLEQEILNSDKEGRQNFDLLRHAYFPVPQRELDANPSMEQSPEW